jgi:hypothetical protein
LVPVNFIEELPCWSRRGDASGKGKTAKGAVVVGNVIEKPHRSRPIPACDSALIRVFSP